MYSIDIRKIALLVYSKLNSFRKTANLLGIKSHATVRNWIVRLENKKYEYKSVSQFKSFQILALLKCILDQQPLLSLMELQKLLEKEYNIEASKELIRGCISRLGYSWKKVRFYGVSKYHEVRTQEFLSKRENALKTSKKCLFIDEVSFGRNTFKVMGYNPKGEKLHVRKKQPRMTSESVIACVSRNALVLKQRHKTAVNRFKFLDFLRDIPLDSNTVIFMDNVRFHHSKIVKDYLIAKNVEVIYTPPYSPWFNPIEYCFSIVKRIFQREQDIDSSFEGLQKRHIEAFYQKAMSLTSNVL